MWCRNPRDLDGIPLRFFDTAGVRETTDQVERIGVTRTLETLTEADLACWLSTVRRRWSDEDLSVRERIRGLPHLVVANKADLAVDPRSGAREAWKPIWSAQERAKAWSSAGSDSKFSGEQSCGGICGVRC